MFFDIAAGSLTVWAVAELSVKTIGKTVTDFAVAAASVAGLPAGSSSQAEDAAHTAAPSSTTHENTPIFMAHLP